jgi:glycosyltransferase involved in cell wall biosynthesis
MRILKVHNYYTRPGGEDTVFRAETTLLRSAGHEVWEYLEDNEKIETMNKVSIALQTLWSNTSYRRLKKFLQEVQPEVVHFHNTFPLISPSAYYACQDLNIPVVQTLDNQRLICPASTFYRNEKPCLNCLGKTLPWPGVLHACYHDSHLHTAVVASMVTLHKWLGTWGTKVDTFLCSTSFYRNLFVQAGFPADKIAVMPHFVQQQLWVDSNENPGDYALFVGRLDPEKGVKTLLEAWRLLDFPLMIRGEGRLGESAREFVKKHGLKNIKFLERMSERELSDLIGQARFLIMPSEGYYETFGMVIIEAYARGVPVIASNIGVVPELVSDGHSGVLFKAGDPQDLAQKVRWMWDHPSQAKVIGDNGRAVYLERFTQDQCYETLIEVYARLINAR